jgi:signal peptidase I
MSLQSEARKAARDGTMWETVKVVVQALLLAMVVRVFFYQPFNIPSGSMKQTLLVGDYLFVSKLAYGYSRYSFPGSLNLFSGRLFYAEPKRGDVAVFRLPRDPSVDYIKRVIGLPGDEIQMRRGVLHINGKAVPKVRLKEDFETREDGGPRMKIPVYEETLPNGVKYRVLDIDPNGQLDNTEVFKVPAGHYFMMGDNRDNSSDSRVWGQVPERDIVGKAFAVWMHWANFLSIPSFDRVGMIE